MKIFRVTFHLNFDIDATSKEVALEKAENEAMEWLREIESVEASEITIEEVSNA